MNGESTNSAVAERKRHGLYAWYIVGVLMFAYCFSFIDRQILSLLIGPVRADLSISDLEISVLIGFAFALFYTFMGIPLGWIADRYHRVRLILVGVIFWSLMVVGCGLSNSFWSLFVFRMGVGVGEAALSPASYSLISDYFPRERIGTALGTYAMGIFIGAGLAYILGGQLVELVETMTMPDWPLVGALKPWQLVFIAVALPGVLVVAFLLTIREPPRRNLADGSTHTETAGHFGETLRFLWDRRQIFLPFFAAGAVASSFGYAVLAWMPEFCIRILGMGKAEAGTVFGTIVLIVSTASIFLAGFIADGMIRRGVQDAHLRVLFLAGAAFSPLMWFLPWVDGTVGLVLIGIPMCVLLGMPYGVMPAAIQLVSPSNMRGQIAAIYLFCNNLIGLGLAPSMVAFLTDKVFQDDFALDKSIAIVLGITGPLFTLLFYQCLAGYRHALTRAEAGDWAVRPATP